MAEWMQLALIHCVVGFEVIVLGILKHRGTSREDVEGLLITGFLLYVVCAVLMTLTKVAGLAANMIISLIVCIGLIIAAVLIVAAVGVLDKNNNPYTATLEVSSAALAVLAAIFIILNLVGGGGSRTGPS